MEFNWSYEQLKWITLVCLVKAEETKTRVMPLIRYCYNKVTHTMLAVAFLHSVFTSLMTNLYTVWLLICVSLRSVNSVGFLEMSKSALTYAFGKYKIQKNSEVWFLQFIQILSLWLKSLCNLLQFLAEDEILLHQNTYSKHIIHSGDRIWIYDYRNQQSFIIHVSLVFVTSRIKKSFKLLIPKQLKVNEELWWF